MPFFYKKLISALLQPLPVSLFFLLMGACILLWTRKRKTGLTLLTAGVGILFVFSLTPVANTLLNSLENQYQPLVTLPTHVKTIVVLGGGSGGRYQYPPNTRLSSASLSRLIEAIRLYRQNPNSILILSGGRVFGSPAEATVMNNTAIALGVKRDHMIIEAGSKDTRNEALFLKSILKKEPFALVTSASHMPRAMALFKKLGMNPIAAPTQFLAKQNHTSIHYYLPNVVSLVHSDIAIHEYVGIEWAKLQNYI